MRRSALLIAGLMLFYALALAQTKTITGQVKDAKGDPVPFANITIKGTTSGVAADANGNFRIEVQPGQSLIITSASFVEQEVKIGNESTLSITMQPQGNLQEVVVTALGIRRTRNQLPYAAQTVEGNEVSKNRSNNFVNNLSGKVAGLEIRQTNTLGGSTNVVLRGTKSFVGNNQALFVVDGVPYNNDNTNTANQTTGRGGYDYGNAAADINPDDIESVSVLKGAAASALYGSRGNNGVILITTKKATRGLGITVNSGFGFGKIDKSTFTKYQKEYGAGYGAYYGPNEDSYFNEFDVNGDGIPDKVVPTTEDASYGARFDPSLLVYQWNAFDATSPFYKQATPWVAAANDPTSFFQTATSSNQSVFVDGASDKGSFKLGYTRTDDRGILPNSKVSKNLVNFGGTYNITSALTASATANFSNITGRGRYGTGYDDKNVATNFRQWWETNVDIKEQKEAYFRTSKNITWNWANPRTEAGLVPIFWDNPYFVRYQNYENDGRNRIFGNINLNYKITDWLNIMGRVGLDTYNEQQEERQAVGSIGIPSYRRVNRSYTEINYDLLANLDKDLSQDFNFKALLGLNIRNQHTKSIDASTNGGLTIPGIYSLNNSANPLNAPTEFDGERQVDGVFAGATLTWRDMITLDGTIRRDKSSTLPEGNNVYYYPSGSLGFTFSKLLPDVGWLSYGKARVNYAEVGNDAPLYSVLNVYNILPPFGSSPTTTIPSTRNNPNLKPERTRSLEAGLEMSFLKSRVGFDVSYYSAKTIDQILPLAITPATGYSFKFLNSGTIQNRGVEVSLFGTPVQTKTFSWNINLNWTRNRNKVIDLFEHADNLVLATFQGGVSLNATLNQPYGTIRGSNFIYTNGQRTVDEDGYYLTSPTSNEVIGNPNPDWIGGINNTFKYKDFSLSFLVDMRQGGDVWSLDLFYGMGTGLYPETAGLNDLGKPSRDPVSAGGGVVMPGVHEDGKTNVTHIPNEYATFGAEDLIPAAGFVYDASYVKLREAVLSYSLPKSVMAKIHPFKGIDLSLIGRNLWIIHKNLPYSDPEETMSSGNLQGYQGGAYPTTRTFAFNIRLRF
ncbi:MAG TPA: SusC/RagA family TonB-linked outer membrane protein [Chitinophagaceae bacterium]|nr:SusC/RagA family TonB-linked outer membrane protein [Chitinophagaceae bacterium]